MNDSDKTIIKTYTSTFTSLTRENIETLIELMADDVIFKDPFNTTEGKTGFTRILNHMFATCENPHFTISDIAHGQNAHYLRWQMTAKLRSWPRSKLFLEGMSEIRIDSNGLISHHIDHWDSASQLLVALPVIRVVLHPIMRLFRVK